MKNLSELNSSLTGNFLYDINSLDKFLKEKENLSNKLSL